MIQVEWTASQKVIELNMLQSFLEDKGIKRIFEIGTFFGGTALLWAKMVAPSGHVYCLDAGFPPGKVYAGTEWEQLITEIVGNSHESETKDKVCSVIQEPVDMLFIDGDHSYEGVRKDFCDYSTLVKDGGFVVFHDIRDTEVHRNTRPPDGPILVALFWEEIKKQHKHWEILDPNDATYMGIGVLQV